MKIKITPVTEDYRLAQTLARKYVRNNKNLTKKRMTPEHLVEAAIQQLKLNHWDVSENRKDYLEKQISVFVETALQEMQSIISQQESSSVSQDE